MRCGVVMLVETIDFASKSALFLPCEAQYECLDDLLEDNEGLA